jgi:amino acid transporter
MSYRNAGRVAYATVNGQTGKVVTDLPVDIRKYLLGSLVLAIPIFVLLNLFLTLMPSTLLIITTVLAGIALAIYFSELGAIKKKEKLEKKKDMGLITAIAALILGIGITILQPVSDLFYYGGALVSLVGIFVTIKDIMYYYNIMTTRRLPQFDRTGGDDRA